MNSVSTIPVLKISAIWILRMIAVLLFIPLILLWVMFFTQTIETTETRAMQKIEVPSGYTLYEELLTINDSSVTLPFNNQDFSKYLRANPTGSIVIKQNTNDSSTAKGTFVFVARGNNGKPFNAMYFGTIECVAYTMRKEKDTTLEKGDPRCTYDFTKNESVYIQNLHLFDFLTTMGFAFANLFLTILGIFLLRASREIEKRTK